MRFNCTKNILNFLGAAAAKEHLAVGCVNNLERLVRKVFDALIEWHLRHRRLMCATNAPRCAFAGPRFRLFLKLPGALVIRQLWQYVIPCLKTRLLAAGLMVQLSAPGCEATCDRARRSKTR